HCDTDRATRSPRHCDLGVVGRGRRCTAAGAGAVAVGSRGGRSDPSPGVARRGGRGQVVRTFVPAVMARGAAQIASFIDLAIAGFLPGGAVAAIANAQVLYTLPVSLFGMAVSAAELPEMARAGGDGSAVASALRVRLDAATQRLAYYIIPSAMAFLAI